MLRQVCTLTTGLVLLALLIDTPAHAQWAKGNIYYGASFVSGATVATTTTQTASASTAIIGFDSTPINASPGYSTSGQMYGNVYQDYNWIGGSNAQRTDFLFSRFEESKGNISAYGSASSSTDFTSGSASNSSSSSYDDSTNTAGGSFTFTTGDTITMR